MAGALTQDRREQQAAAFALFSRRLSVAQVAEQLEVPKGTVKRWRAAWAKGEASPEPATSDNREGEADTPDSLAFWAEQVRYLDGAHRRAVAGGKGALVGTLGAQLLKARVEYDKALKATEAERALAERAERAEPGELAERIGEALPVLGRLVERSVVEGWIAQLEKVLGER
jgi:hypothetical protein